MVTGPFLHGRHASKGYSSEQNLQRIFPLGREEANNKLSKQVHRMTDGDKCYGEKIKQSKVIGSMKSEGGWLYFVQDSQARPHS